MRSKVGRRARALVRASVLAVTMVAIFAGVALANPPNPATVDASSSGNDVTVSGTWHWPDVGSPCDGHAVGWAVDWGDPSDAGNPVAKGYSVGTSTDNVVRTN